MGTRALAGAGKIVPPPLSKRGAKRGARVIASIRTNPMWCDLEAQQSCIVLGRDERRMDLVVGLRALR
jgi:hypothetical protein